MSLSLHAIAPAIDVKLLAMLLDGGGHQTITALALGCDMQPAQVASEIVRLRRAGCVLDEHPQHGVKLIEAGLGCWADYLESLSPGKRRVTVYGKTSSTQDICRTLGEHTPENTPGGTTMIVLADEQTAGRGRLGRRWIAPPGTAVTFSQTHQLASGRNAQTIDRVNFATTVGVAGAIESFLDAAYRPVRIKWPNDVLVNGRKIAGILVETASNTSGVEAAIIGVGINVSLQPHHLPDDDPALRERMTSLAMCGLEVDRLRVAAKAIEQIHTALHETDTDTLAGQWRARSVMLHHHVRLQTDGHVVEGEVIDLDPSAGLIVRTTTGNLLHLPAATTTVL